MEEIVELYLRRFYYYDKYLHGITLICYLITYTVKPISQSYLESNDKVLQK